jgi:hypothetical protein
MAIGQLAFRVLAITQMALPTPPIPVLVPWCSIVPFPAAFVLFTL